VAPAQSLQLGAELCWIGHRHVCRIQYASPSRSPAGRRRAEAAVDRFAHHGRDGHAPLMRRSQDPLMPLVVDQKL
jgi:hypothetical protein